MPKTLVQAAAEGMPKDDRTATTAEAAALDFDPWPKIDWSPPSNAEWAQLANPYLVTIRMAWLIVQKTKPEVMEVVDGLEDDAGRELMDSFMNTMTFFESMTTLLKTAEARILCAGSAVIERLQKGEIDDPATLPVIFAAEADDDWKDEAVWHAVNPGMRHGYPDLDSYRDKAKKAINSPSDRDSFLQFNLNVWLDHSASPFVEMSVYDEGRADVDLAAYEAEQTPCWLGVDLSSNSDLTAVVAAWGSPEDGYAVHPWFFCPEDNLRRRADKDGVPYPQWAEDGHITPTPGNVVDFRMVEDQIRELCARFNVREIAFDPHLARNTLINLLEDGLPAVEMRQGWVTMAPAIKELERAIIGRRFRHGGHPILRWHFDNVAVETDKAGNRAFHKGKSKDRIDGAVACAMAVARAAAGDGATIYDREDWSDDMAYF